MRFRDDLKKYDSIDTQNLNYEFVDFADVEEVFNEIESVLNSIIDILNPISGLSEIDNVKEDIKILLEKLY